MIRYIRVKQLSNVLSDVTKMWVLMEEWRHQSPTQWSTLTIRLTVQLCIVL